MYTNAAFTTIPYIQIETITFVWISSSSKRTRACLSSIKHHTIRLPRLVCLDLVAAHISMERKRKLPARAAARVEHVSKKRNSTPPDVSTTSTPSSTLTSPQPAEPVAQEPPPPPTSAPLPKSLQPGHPLPTVEKPQPDDLSNKEFQSIQERYPLPTCLRPVCSV